MAIFDVSTPYQKQKALLAMYGIMIMLSTAFLGTWMFGVIVAPNLALLGGLSAVVFVGGCLGFTLVLIQQAIQQVNIKIVKEE